MRVVALVSGGKDSCYNLLQCVAAGHEIVALANLQPENKAPDELDSFMYQTVGHQGVSLYAEAMGLPLFRQYTSGVAHHQDKWYTPTVGDEVEDLYKLLQKVKSEIDIEAVSSGAVLSDYQRLRVENVCSRLGLISLAYLWRREQGELLQEMIDCNVEALVIKVAALGLDPAKHLGLNLSQIQPHLLKMNEKYGLNICGEGGEYETFTIDCPLFKKRIAVDAYETVIHSDDAIAPVGYLNFKRLSLVDKTNSYTNEVVDLIKCIAPYSIKGPLEYVSDLEESANQLGDSSDCEDIEITCENIGSMKDMLNIFTQSSNERCDTALLKEENGHVCINSSGWCWISSVIGSHDDLFSAMDLALNNLLNLLTTHQYPLSSLVSVTLFVRDMTEYAKLNSLYVHAINCINAPVRVCVEIPLPAETPIVIEAVAHKQPSSDNSSPRRTMHVQSISHWAPASIGPYSQAIMIGDIIYIAGQIPLVPGTMVLLDVSVRRQCRLALRHIGRIIKSMDPNMLLRDIVQGICYVTHSDYIQSAKQEWERKSNNAIVDYMVVSRLPRDAKIEWHVWAHRGNSRFQYEETGYRIDKSHKAFLRKRFNYENTVAVVVCYLTKDERGGSVEGNVMMDGDSENRTLNENQIEQLISYTMKKLMSGDPQSTDLCCNMRIFYRVNQQHILRSLYNVLTRIKNNFEYANDNSDDSNNECDSNNKNRLTFTLIPVLQLHHINTVLSLSAIRHS